LDTSSNDCFCAALLLDGFVGTVVEDDTIVGVANDDEEEEDSCERLAALEIGREEEVEDNLLDPDKSEMSLADVK
jgi:hypothetical protein